MWHPRVIYLRFATLCLLVVAVPDLILGLQHVSVTVPTAVKRGDNAQLICNYDMEGDTLYSVKWYKGRREFYRYTPKENPAMKIFSQSGINVVRALSNQSHVVLSSVELNISGKYSCEVSADAPSFHTVIVSGDMEVVELPEQRPSLTGIHTRYRLGDVVNGNCSSHYSKPAANLTWTINDIPTTIAQTKTYKPNKNPLDNLEYSVVEISFSITPQHFIKGRLKLKCTARIHGIYEQDVERYIEEDRPRILASGRSPDVNLFPFDQQADGELSEQNELYLTHYKDMASAASSSIRCVRLSTTTTITSVLNAIFYAVIILLIVFVSNLKWSLLMGGTERNFTTDITGISSHIHSDQKLSTCERNLGSQEGLNDVKSTARSNMGELNIGCNYHFNEHYKSVSEFYKITSRSSPKNNNNKNNYINNNVRKTENLSSSSDQFGVLIITS